MRKGITDSNFDLEHAERITLWGEFLKIPGSGYMRSF